MKGSSQVAVKYYYHMTMHMGLCHGPVDVLTKIEADEKEAWSGSTTTNINIDNLGLFGGDEHEGGIKGDFYVQNGEPSQAVNSILSALLGVDIPAFRGVCCLLVNAILIANSTYIKPFAFTVRRRNSGWDTSDGNPWYSAKLAIGDYDMNPIHIIYEVITNRKWGMGYPAAIIDDANFKLAADICYAENFGLSIQWQQQDTIENFLKLIFDHINGALRVNQSTGLYQIKLIRDDYNIEDLPVFNQSNIIKMASYQRASISETINELSLEYTDPSTRKTTSITVHNLANIQSQNAVVNQNISLMGIANHDLAARVAMRELNTRSSPLAKVKIQVNRKAWGLLQGDVFVLSWPAYGLSSAVMRVVNINYGELDDSTISIEAIEDVFGLPTNSYAAQQNSGWQNPSQRPYASPARKFVEATYFDLATTLTSAELAEVQPDDGYVIMYAQRSTSLDLNYRLKTALHGGLFAQVSIGPHCPTAILATDLAAEEHSTITVSALVGSITSASGSPIFRMGNYAIIDDEYVRVDSFNQATGVIALARGVIDTVPKHHNAGAKIYFAQQLGTADKQAWVADTQVDAKVITQNALGLLADADAPIDTRTITARQNKPYPPAKFRINGDYMPEAVAGTINLSWVHRNRLQQTVYLLAQDENSVTPESGVTYEIRLYKGDGSLGRTVTELAGTSYTYSIDDELADLGEQTVVTVELYAVRDGIQSHQLHRLTFERVYGGWGFDWGNNWGG